MSASSPSTSTSQILLLVPLSLGKTLKTALEQRDILDKEEKISRVVLGPDGLKSSTTGEEFKADIVGARATADTRRNEDAVKAGKETTGMKENKDEGGRENGNGCVRLCVPTTIKVDSTILHQNHLVPQPPFSSIPHHRRQEQSTAPAKERQILKENLLNEISMEEHGDEITLVLRPSLFPLSTTTTNKADPEDPIPRQMVPASTSGSPSLLARVIEKWYLSLPPTISAPAPILPSLSYTIYPPMLLLPERMFTVVAELVANRAGGGVGAGECRGKKGITMTKNEELMEELFKRLCEAFKVTHIALSGPIPAMMLEEQPGERGRLDSSASVTSSFIFESANSKEELPSSPSSPSSPPAPEPPKSPNILRSPLNSFTPLHNDFGPSLPTHHVPTRDDFAKAFWCTVRQNGIFQTWAPRHTMFSRGNLSEKTRLLKLLNMPSRTMRMNKNTEQSVAIGLVERGGVNEEEKEPRRGERRERELISAVDLYAGIGYFAFCYAAKKEVVGKVFCWEISRWSVEGLRRGAVGNGWGVRVFEGGQDDGDGNGTEKEGNGQRLTVYQESNQCAAARIAAMRAGVPPVRHVNCGFLPSSKESWETAVQVLDPTQGGWIHAHENIAVRSFERRRMEILEDFRGLVERHHRQGKEDKKGEPELWQVECVHFEQVKTYAPGVAHCVLDISVLRIPCPPTDTAPQTTISTPSVQK